MSVSAAPDEARPQAPTGLSARTQQLWLAAEQCRRRADELAAAGARRVAP